VFWAARGATLSSNMAPQKDNIISFFIASPSIALRARRPFTAEALTCSHAGGLLRRQAPVSNMAWALENTALVRPDQGWTASTVDGNGDRVRQIAVPASDGAEDAVGADPAHVHDIARGAGLAEFGSGGSAVGCLGESHGPGRPGRVRGTEVRRGKPDKVHAPGAAGYNPGEVVSPCIAVDLPGRGPRLSLI